MVAASEASGDNKNSRQVITHIIECRVRYYRITRGVRTQKKPFSESKYSNGLAGA